MHLVIIKCSLLTSAKGEEIEAAGRKPVTTGAYDSMAIPRYASAVGIAIALKELEENQLEEAMRNETCWTTRAS